jgi:pyridoxal phosphate enzyme (YggS family)
VKDAGSSGEFKLRLEEVRARIECAARRVGRDAGRITLVAVSKMVPVGRLQEAMACGCRVFGENRVQEALAKMEALAGASEAPAVPGRARGPGASEPIPMGARAPAEVEWHLIGPLQSNKVNAVTGRFALIHALDRLDVAERLDRATRARGLLQPVLLEVNVAGETSKHGFAPDGLLSAAGKIATLAGLRVLGLMAIPPVAPVPEAARPYFRKVKELAAQVEARRIPGVSMAELSMGMSGDFEVAIEEGATMVRIGTALFGARP